MSDRKPTAQRSKARDEKFIAALLEGLGPVKSAKQAGYSVAAVYKRRKADETFAKAWEEANEIGIEVKLGTLEDEAHRRAVEGIDKPIYHQGQLVDTIKEYSDSLLMFLMKKLDPTYRDRMDVNHSGELKNVTPVVNVTLSGTES